MSEQTSDRRMKFGTILKLLAAVLCIILSITVLRPILTNSSTYKSSAEYLDKKMNTATMLTVGTTSASLLVSLIPDDVGSAIADELAEFSGYLLLVVSAIFLERYLMTTLGFIAATIVFPLGFALAGLSVLANVDGKKALKEHSVRLLIFGLCLIVIIPLGCTCGQAIEDANSTSIQMALDATKEAEEIVEELPEEGDKSIFAQVGDFFSGLWSSATEGYEWAKTALSNFMSAVAVMLVTTIAIPILILFCFMWLIRFLTKRDFAVTIVKLSKSFADSTKHRLHKATPRIKAEHTEQQ